MAYSGEAATLVQLIRLVSVAGAEGSRTVVELYGTRSDAFTGAASGTAINAAVRPMRAFALQVKGTGAAPTSWTVVLEGSLDGTTFTTILTHTNTANADGATVFSSAVLTPCLHFRSRCSAVALGSASDIVATILGVP